MWTGTITRYLPVVFWSCLAFGLGSAGPAHAQSFPYDLVIQGGRVIDPETDLDAIRTIGIRNGHIAEISETPLIGQQVVNVPGLVVSPGFIDLHAHGQTNAANEYQAHDGVTTALELESGQNSLRKWLDSRTGQALINFGATVSHGSVRQQVMLQFSEQSDVQALEVRQRAIRRSRYAPVPEGGYDRLLAGLDQGLQAGGLGIGVPVGYYPGASGGEILQVYRLAAVRQAPIFTHVRNIGLSGIQEAVTYAAVTGAPLHIVHLNSMTLGDIATGLEIVTSAQAQGLDITTEIYPYTAASTNLASSLFARGWQARMGIGYEDLQWQDTGERLTEESFSLYRAEGGIVIIHLMEPAWITTGLASQTAMIASDGMPYAPGAHPRSAGTFSRVLGRYVRELKVLTLSEALAKMTIQPAQRLQDIAPSMRLKGRLQIGADADVTVFDPDTIIDTATFDGALSFSRGVRHVLVHGTFVVRDGETVQNVFPGRPVMGRYRQ